MLKMARYNRDAIINYYENLRSKKRLIENELEEIEILWDMPKVYVRRDGEKHIAAQVINNMKQEINEMKTDFTKLKQELVNTIAEGKKFQNEANERTAHLRENYEKIAGVLRANGYTFNNPKSSSSGFNSSFVTSNQMKTNFPENTSETLFSVNVVSSTIMTWTQKKA